MRQVRFFMFLVALPALLGLGYDAYMWYAQGQGAFTFYTPAYIWAHYDPASLNWVGTQLDPKMRPWLDFILNHKTAEDGAAFAGFFYVILLIMRIFKWGPFSIDRYDTRTRVEKILGKEPQQFKFKRR